MSGRRRTAKGAGLSCAVPRLFPPAGTRPDHANAMMDLLEQFDVDAVDYDPDGFDGRVKAVRQQFKALRREA